MSAVLATSGRALDTPTRTLLEPRFGHSFANVRIHDDEQASRSAKAVGARAYAIGRHIVFGAGEYRPGDPSGMWLLAHEMAHVAQQGGAEPRKTATGSTGADVKTHIAAPNLTPSARRLQRYATSDCADSDVTNKISPGDYTARAMVDKAVRILSTGPMNPAVNHLFRIYFMTETPDVPSILAVYKKIQSALGDNTYTYQCEDNCEHECGFVRDWRSYFPLASATIHLCTNKLSSSRCFGTTMVHEFSHYSARTRDRGDCHIGCCTSSNCQGLSSDDALDNADSYSSFADELYDIKGI